MTRRRYDLDVTKMKLPVLERQVHGTRGTNCFFLQLVTTELRSKRLFDANQGVSGFVPMAQILAVNPSEPENVLVFVRMPGAIKKDIARASR